MMLLHRLSLKLQSWADHLTQFKVERHLHAEAEFGIAVLQREFDLFADVITLQQHSRVCLLCYSIYRRVSSLSEAGNQQGLKAAFGVLNTTQLEAVVQHILSDGLSANSGYKAFLQSIIIAPAPYTQERCLPDAIAIHQQEFA